MNVRWIVAALGVLVLAFVCVQLGRWQFHRLDERKARNEVTRTNLAAAPAPIDQILGPPGVVGDQHAWRTAVVTGRYDAAKQIVLKYRNIDDRPGFNVTAFELTEARLLFEGESAALAATNITDAELDELEALVRQISDENQRRSVSENADRDFHMLIARSTRNLAIVNAIEELWRLRSTSPECALLHAKARAAKVRPVVEEHSAIVEALRTRDPAKARAAMRAHLAAVIDHLLFATEEQALAKAREAVASTRRRFGNVASI